MISVANTVAKQVVAHVTGMALDHVSTCAGGGVEGRGMLLPLGSGPLSRLVKTRRPEMQAEEVTAIRCPLLLAGFALKGRGAF